MNIFATDPSPVTSAQMLANRHVVKMPLESAQMLSTVLRRLEAPDARLYKSTHAQHPCTVWAGLSRSNFLWLCKHGDALCAEKLVRYPDKPPHKSQTIIDVARMYADLIPAGGLSPFPQAMPDEFRDECPHTAYRAYLRAKYAGWARPARFGSEKFFARLVA